MLKISMGIILSTTHICTQVCRNTFEHGAPGENNFNTQLFRSGTMFGGIELNLWDWISGKVKSFKGIYFHFQLQGQILLPETVWQ